MTLSIITILITGLCDASSIDYQPPLDCLPVWNTNFTPYLLDDSGEPLLIDGTLQFPQETNYNCMVPCDLTGTLIPITLDSIDYFAACMDRWLGHRIEVNGHNLWCVDQYGSPEFRKPFYHEGLNSWVIGVDTLTHKPTAQLTYDWEK